MADTLQIPSAEETALFDNLRTAIRHDRDASDGVSKRELESAFANAVADRAHGLEALKRTYQWVEGLTPKKGSDASYLTDITTKIGAWGLANKQLLVATQITEELVLGTGPQNDVAAPDIAEPAPAPQPVAVVAPVEPPKDEAVAKAAVAKVTPAEPVAPPAPPVPPVDKKPVEQVVQAEPVAPPVLAVAPVVTETPAVSPPTAAVKTPVRVVRPIVSEAPAVAKEAAPSEPPAVAETPAFAPQGKIDQILLHKWQDHGGSEGGIIKRTDLSAHPDPYQREVLLEQLKAKGIEAKIIHDQATDRDYMQYADFVKRADLSAYPHPYQREVLLEQLKAQGIEAEVVRDPATDRDYMQVADKAALDRFLTSVKEAEQAKRLQEMQKIIADATGVEAPHAAPETDMNAGRHSARLRQTIRSIYGVDPRRTNRQAAAKAEQARQEKARENEQAASAQLDQVKLKLEKEHLAAMAEQSRAALERENVHLASIAGFAQLEMEREDEFAALEQRIAELEKDKTGKPKKKKSKEAKRAGLRDINIKIGKDFLGAYGETGAKVQGKQAYLDHEAEALARLKLEFPYHHTHEKGSHLHPTVAFWHRPDPDKPASKIFTVEPGVPGVTTGRVNLLDFSDEALKKALKAAATMQKGDVWLNGTPTLELQDRLRDLASQLLGPPSQFTDHAGNTMDKLSFNGVEVIPIGAASPTPPPASGLPLPRFTP